MEVSVAFIIIAMVFSQVCCEKITGESDVPGFKNVGSYHKAKSDNSTKTKTYWISTHFRTFWHAAKSFCHSFGMELLSLDTLEEAQKFMNICVTNKLFVDRCFHIGGLTTVPSSKTEWFWVNSFKKVKYEMPWLPKEPNYLGKNEMCLSICKNPGQCGYNDIPCSSSAELTFVCQSRN